MEKYDDLEQRIQDNLYELFAKDFKHARDGEIFTSLANSLRQIIGKKWYKTYYDNLSNKKTYLLSFEYSLGDQLLKSLIKLNLSDALMKLLNDKNIDFENIKKNDIEFAIGFGDLSEVSSNLLRLFTSQSENFYAYGLRYRRGMLKQEIVGVEQVEKPDDWKVNKNPWEHEKGFSHYVYFKDFAVKAIPYDIPILSNDGDFVNTLRLWKSFSINDLDFRKFSEGNILESYNEINRANAIVEFLYPSENNENGRKLRLIQEYFFASSSIQDILKKYKKYNEDDIKNIYKHIKIQIHDIHPVLSILVFIDMLMGKYDISFEESLDIAKKTFVFLHLSLLPESFEKWEIDLINQVCPNILDIILKLDKHIKDEFLEGDKEFDYSLLAIQDGYVDMLNIAYYVSKNIIVSNQSQIELIKNKYLTNHYKHYNEKIVDINIPFDKEEFLKEIYNNKDIKEDITNKIDTKKFDDLKLNKKKDLLKSLDISENEINIHSAFISHLGVFHEYKRQILSILGVALQYYRLKVNPNLDIPERTYFFGGKSYPNYYIAKENIKFINALANQVNNDLYIKDKIKIVFIENYNLKKSSIAIPATDIYQRLELLSMQSSDFDIEKTILTGGSVITSNSLHDKKVLDENDIKVYSFGEDREKIINRSTYNLYELLKENKEINDLFNFYRSLPKETFPYDINKIYDAIYYFNDEYHILKDLQDYVEVLEKAINDYLDEDKWLDDRKHNIEKQINESEEQNITKYKKVME